MIRDPKLRFMVHKVLPCFLTMFIPWLLVFGFPLYVLTRVYLELSRDDWECFDSDDQNPLLDYCFILTVTQFILYFSFMLGLFMIPFWLVFGPYKLFKIATDVRYGDESDEE